MHDSRRGCVLFQVRRNGNTSISARFGQHFGYVFNYVLSADYITVRDRRLEASTHSYLHKEWYEYFRKPVLLLHYVLAPSPDRQLCSTLQEAIDAGSFFSEVERTLSNGDVTTGFGASDQVIDGEVYVGSQEHFYMEPHSCVAVPRGEDGEMDVYSSTQAATTVQVL